MKSNRYILLILTAILAISCSDQNHGNWVIVLHPHENIEDKILPESKSPITLLELGLHARSGKLLVICPEKFYRYDNVRITCQKYNILMFNSIEDAIEKII